MSNLIPTHWRDSIEHLRDNVVDTFDRWVPERLRREKGAVPTAWPAALFTQGGPAVDVVDDGDSVKVTAELPGLSENDFAVEVRGNRLYLRGEKKADCEETGRDYYYSECTYGSFSRVIVLPAEVDSDCASATYKHGVLTITLPKTESARAKHIKVDIS